SSFRFLISEKKRGELAAVCAAGFWVLEFSTAFTEGAGLGLDFGSMTVPDGSGEPCSRFRVSWFAVGRPVVRGWRIWPVEIRSRLPLVNSEPCSRLARIIRYSVVRRPRETFEGSISLNFSSSFRIIFWTPRRVWLVFRARVSMLGEHPVPSSRA